MALLLPLLDSPCDAFVVPSHRLGLTLEQSCRSQASASLLPPLMMGYAPPDEEGSTATTTTKKSLHPKAGDMVRYYDIDGGKKDGQVLVGKISFISTDLGKENSWTVELTEMEDVGDGYYAEYPSRKRQSKKATRNLANVSPLMASFVRAENAFKVPIEAATGRPKARADTYDLDDYLGPFSGGEDIDQDVIAKDGITYSTLKGKLLLNAAIAGAAGAVITDLLKGTEDAIIFAAGALASVAYLFFLSIKTDTVGSQDAKLGKSVANIRFLMPVLVVVAVALYNKSLGDANPVQGDNPFDTITPEQYGAAILGFLTYRIPLFLTQLLDAFKDESGNIALPGSAGVAMQMAQQTDGSPDGGAGSLSDAELTPVLVVSGPQATGRSRLVEKLIAEGDGRFVGPKLLDQVKDGVTFERLQNRGEILEKDASGRYAITRDGILSATAGSETESVVVVDANVSLARKLTSMTGARLIGVWVGLNSVKEFEQRIGEMVDNGEITIPEDESRESVVRARIREVVQEIEFGISSGIFEFTILNENEEESLKQLREAANYSFK